MFIDIVYRFFKPRLGGVESHISQLAPHLASRGHSVRIHASRASLDTWGGAPPSYSHEGFEVVWELPLLPRSAIFFPRISKLADLIHFHGFDRMLYHATTKVGHHRPIIITPHGALAAPVVSRATLGGKLRSFHDNCFAQQLLNKSIRIVALNEFERGEIVDRWGINPGKVVTIPNGIPSKFIDMPRNGLELPESVDGLEYIFAACRIDKRKNLTAVLRILVSIKNLHFVLCGADEGDLANILRTASNLGIADRIHYMGRVPESLKISLLDNCLAFVLTSHFEMQPIALLEAMARGKATVAAAVGGIPNMITNGINGLLYQPGNEIELANAVLKLLEDPSYANQLGNNARQTVRNDYRWDQVAARIENLYHGAAKEGLPLLGT